VCVKLAKQAHNFYEEVKVALAAPPLKDHFDKSWSAHATAKAAAFHAEALQRAAKVAEEEEDIGPAIARLQVAAKVLHDAVKAVKVGRCRLTASKSVLEAPMVSAIETRICWTAFKLCFHVQLAPLHQGHQRHDPGHRHVGHAGGGLHSSTYRLNLSRF